MPPLLTGMQCQQMLLNQRPLASSHNTHNHHQQQQQHHPQMLQNCTNILPMANSIQQSQNCSIWSHPGLQPSEKKARLDLTPNIQNSLPCSASSPNHNNTDELTPSSSSSSSASSVASNHHNLGASPESSPPAVSQLLWPSTREG